MVRLKNIDATSLVSVIQPMISHDGLVAAFPEDNTLIITDDAYNVERLLRIIGSLDVQGTRQNIEVIPLKLAFADDLASQIEKIMGGPKVVGTGWRFHGPASAWSRLRRRDRPVAFKVVPDERTNSLIVLAGPLQMRTIKELVVKLDIHPPNENSRIHVYRLKNAQALEMVQVLNNLLNGGSGPTTLSAGNRAQLARPRRLGLQRGRFGAVDSGFGGGGRRLSAAVIRRRWFGGGLRRRRWRRWRVAVNSSFGGGSMGSGRWAAAAAATRLER